MSELSRRILQRRLELGLSQEELAQRMGYRSKSSITKLEDVYKRQVMFSMRAGRAGKALPPSPWTARRCSALRWMPCPSACTCLLYTSNIVEGALIDVELTLPAGTAAIEGQVVEIDPGAVLVLQFQPDGVAIVRGEVGALAQPVLELVHDAAIGQEQEAVLRVVQGVFPSVLAKEQIDVYKRQDKKERKDESHEIQRNELYPSGH